LRIFASRCYDKIHLFRVPNARERNKREDRTAASAHCDSLLGLISSSMQNQIIAGALAFNIYTPTLEQIVPLAFAIAALVAAVAWLSHLRGQSSRTRCIIHESK
jgi:hypothetical protein